MTYQPIDAVKLSTHYECVGVGCKSWYCPDCCLSRGLKLRDRLIPVLGSYRRIIMLTLTIDPKQFTDPQQAHSYLTTKRCVSRLIRELRNRGFLHSDRYFAVKEFQRNTKMTHYHVLIDADFVPIDIVREIWGRYAPDWYVQPKDDNSPKMGTVKFSAPRFADSHHAACYACKYLMKEPEEGYPEWVLHSKSRVTRYTTSRGFWGDPPEEEECEQDKKPKLHDIPLPCPDVCFCERCRGDVVIEEDTSTTIDERVSNCCSSTAVLQVDEWMTTDGMIHNRYEFVARVGVDPQAIALDLGIQTDGRRSFHITEATAESFRVGQVSDNNNINPPPRQRPVPRSQTSDDEAAVPAARRSENGLQHRN